MTAEVVCACGRTTEQCPVKHITRTPGCPFTPRPGRCSCRRGWRKDRRTGRDTVAAFPTSTCPVHGVGAVTPR